MTAAEELGQAGRVSPGRAEVLVEAKRSELVQSGTVRPGAGGSLALSTTRVASGRRDCSPIAPRQRSSESGALCVSTMAITVSDIMLSVSVCSTIPNDGTRSEPASSCGAAVGRSPDRIRS